MTENKRESRLDREDGLREMLHHKALNVVQTIIRRDVEELGVGDVLVVHEQSRLDDGEDVQHRAGEKAGGLQDLGPLDQDAVVAEVVIVDVPDAHGEEV